MVVQTLDSAITIQRISIWETIRTIHWIEIYPPDSAIHLLNNWGQQVNKPRLLTRGSWVALLLEENSDLPRHQCY